MDLKYIFHIGLALAAIFIGLSIGNDLMVRVNPGS